MKNEAAPSSFAERSGFEFAVGAVLRSLVGLPRLSRPRFHTRGYGVITSSWPRLREPLVLLQAEQREL
jgi:hypothetical protein